MKTVNTSIAETRICSLFSCSAEIVNVKNSKSPVSVRLIIIVYLKNKYKYR